MNGPLVATKVVIATLGSLGDLHPCLAIAQELSRRGCNVTIATTLYYKERVEALGMAFHAMRPDWNPTDPKLIRSCEDLKRGLKVLYREMLLPELKDTYRDLLAVAERADLLIAGELVYAAPLVAEKLNSPWVSLILSPFSFFSAIDPPVTVNLPTLIHLRKAGPVVYKAGLNLGRLATRHWSNPVRRLRRDEGLRRECDPVFRDKFSPDLVLALFSRWFAPKQRDWPSQTVQPGFVYFEASQSAELPARLREFLISGSPPIVFTQGSTAVHNPGDFYEVSAIAAKALQCRALLLGTRRTPDQNSRGVLALPYAEYSHVFPHAAVVVHQGGSGTVGEALRAGRPMLIVPYGWDQPDNAARIERLSVGLHIPKHRYTVESATTALRSILEQPRFAMRAAEIRKHVYDENGLADACDEIESMVLPRKKRVVVQL